MHCAVNCRLANEQPVGVGVKFGVRAYMSSLCTATCVFCLLTYELGECLHWRNIMRCVRRNMHRIKQIISNVYFVDKLYDCIGSVQCFYRVKLKIVFEWRRI